MITTPSALSQIIVVTGYSGAGKSTLISAYEDCGFFCIDNLPYELLTPFFQGIMHAHMNHKKIVLGIDVRSGVQLDLFADELRQWRASGRVSIEIIFLTAQPETLLRRFQETRRKHPLADNKPIFQAIDEEQRALAPLQALADVCVATDQLTIAQLRQWARMRHMQATQKVMVTLTSFGFKYGTPADCNFIFDLRSLPNPYFIPELKELDGRSSRIHDYLFSHEIARNYWQRLVDFFIFSVECCIAEGRFFMHIGLGCTGGKHRSVAFVERFSQLKIESVNFFVHHKDIAKSGIEIAQREEGII